MRHRLSTAMVAAIVLVSAGALGKEPDPLFASNEVISIRIAAPLTTLFKERSDTIEYPATLSVPAESGEMTHFDIQLKARGRFRRQKSTCRFPPLRLNVKTSDVKSSVLHKQDKLKLVTHCREGKRYQQSVIREYLAYRLLNTITDYSYRVRLLEITYVDTDKDNRELTRLGFVIEHRDRLAKRIDKPVVAIEDTRYGDLDVEITNLMSVFHYLIGNTDYSQIAGPPGKDCCHNHTLFGEDGEPFLSIPYDFDQSGMVDAPYATPNIRFELRNVKHRLYRGRCRNNALLPATVNVYREKRADMESLINNEATLNKSARKDMLDYIHRFFRSLESETRVQRVLVDRCLK